MQDENGEKDSADANSGKVNDAVDAAQWQYRLAPAAVEKRSGDDFNFDKKQRMLVVMAKMKEREAKQELVVVLVVVSLRRRGGGGGTMINLFCFIQQPNLLTRDHNETKVSELMNSKLSFMLHKYWCFHFALGLSG